MDREPSGVFCFGSSLQQYAAVPGPEPSQRRALPTRHFAPIASFAMSRVPFRIAKHYLPQAVWQQLVVSLLYRKNFCQALRLSVLHRTCIAGEAAEGQKPQPRIEMVSPGVVYEK
jgi:hypothetical protein